MENIKTTKIPLGIKLILILIGCSILGQLINLSWVLYFMNIYFPIPINPLTIGIKIKYVIEYLFLLTLLTIAFYGVFKRNSWARILTIILCAINIVIDLLGLFPIKDAGSISISFFKITILILVTIYLIRKKDFFSK